MDRLDWLEHALRTLAKHYECTEVIVTFGLDRQVALTVEHGWSGQKILARGETLGSAVETAFTELSDAQILEASTRSER